jgi:hypothetical protein
MSFLSAFVNVITLNFGGAIDDVVSAGEALLDIKAIIDDLIVCFK